MPYEQGPEQMTMRKVSLHIEEWATKIPFRITGLTRQSFRAVVLELAEGGQIGRGEALPVHYLKETVESIYLQIEAIASDVERGVDRLELLDLMPAGAARKALDSALWDLEAKQTGRSIWQLTGIEPVPVTTAFTIGIEDTPELTAARAVEADEYPLLKIKVDADRPYERVEAVRTARPDVRLLVDANQAWSFEQLAEIAPRLAVLGVELIEQPLARGTDERLERFESPVPLCCDESCQHRGELREIASRYDIVNIKLDKAGGLTEGLLLERAIRDLGLKVLLGNMGGTSLSMAPSFVLAQKCDYVELDGPLLLKHDRWPSLTCQRGVMGVPDRRLWG
jgi:L-alanine-DL-glutamate epimerase-like enolase superfamily enzyme